MVGGRQARCWGWIFAIHIFQRHSEGDQRVRSPAWSQLKEDQCLQGSRQTQPLPQGPDTAHPFHHTMAGMGKLLWDGASLRPWLMSGSVCWKPSLFSTSELQRFGCKCSRPGVGPLCRARPLWLIVQQPQPVSGSGELPSSSHCFPKQHLRNSWSTPMLQKGNRQGITVRGGLAPRCESRREPDVVSSHNFGRQRNYPQNRA